MNVSLELTEDKNQLMSMRSKYTAEMTSILWPVCFVKWLVGRVNAALYEAHHYEFLLCCAMVLCERN